MEMFRHGHSVGNDKNLIVSNREEGIKKEWGLTATGREQSMAAGMSLMGKIDAATPTRDVLFFTSPFSRTVETAVYASMSLSCSPGCAVCEELKERFFGDYDMQSSTNYELVWKNDAQGTDIKPPGGGESVDDVAARLLSFIQDLEKKHFGCTIIIVSHGDALSILASVLMKTDLAKHRQHGLPNGGIMEIK